MMKKMIVILAVLTLLLGGCRHSPEFSENSGSPLVTLTPSAEDDTQIFAEESIKETIDWGTAGDSITENENPESAETPTIESNIPETTKASTAETEVPQTSTPTEATDLNNYFINNSNVVFEDNALTIRPKYVRWEGDMLVADCFVINGLDKPVYNISVGELTFTNLASAAFGEMEGAVIEARSYIVWTFYFNEDTVQQVNGDLSSLEWYFAVDYSY